MRSKSPTSMYYFDSVISIVKPETTQRMNSGSKIGIEHEGKDL